MSPSLLFSRLSLAIFLSLTLAACSGGDAGTSSGTSTDTNDPANNVPEGSTPADGNAIGEVAGLYIGQMVFENDETDEITIRVDNNGVVAVQANTTGQSTTGQLTSSRGFTSTGTISFTYLGNLCTGTTTYVGQFETDTVIDGTFTSSPVCDTPTGTETLELTGIFNADFDDELQ